MLFKDIISLIKKTITINEYGDSVEQVEKKEVFANKMPIRQTEFYQAMSQGILPSHMFVIRTIDYNYQQTIEYNEKFYKIIRTYDKGEFIELVVQGVVANGNA